MSLVTTVTRVDPKHSQRLLTTVERLFNNGYTYADIANHLVNNDFTTLYGGEWTGSNVARLIRQVGLSVGINEPQRLRDQVAKLKAEKLELEVTLKAVIEEYGGY